MRAEGDGGGQKGWKRAEGVERGEKENEKKCFLKYLIIKSSRNVIFEN